MEDVGGGTGISQPTLASGALGSDPTLVGGCLLDSSLGIGGAPLPLGGGAAANTATTNPGGIATGADVNSMDTDAVVSEVNNIVDTHLQKEIPRHADQYIKILARELYEDFEKFDTEMDEVEKHEEALALLEKGKVPNGKDRFKVPFNSEFNP